MMHKDAMGTHVMGKLVNCDPKFLYALDMEETRKTISEIIRRNGLTELPGAQWHRFDNNSFTALIGLAESHAAIHTWPELGIVTLEVYTCNYERDNSEAARNVFDEIAKLFGKCTVIKKEEIR